MPACGDIRRALCSDFLTLRKKPTHGATFFGYLGRTCSSMPLSYLFIFQAALYALEEKGMMASNIEQKHFTKALATVKPSVTLEHLSYYENW